MCCFFFLFPFLVPQILLVYVSLSFFNLASLLPYYGQQQTLKYLSGCVALQIKIWLLSQNILTLALQQMGPAPWRQYKKHSTAGWLLQLVCLHLISFHAVSSVWILFPDAAYLYLLCFLSVNLTCISCFSPLASQTNVLKYCWSAELQVF